MKNPWKVLGVPRSADRDELRRAYARKLKTTNPEDDPDGFKKLREAYEQALSGLEYRHYEDVGEEVAGANPSAEVPDDDVEEPAPPPEPTAEQLEVVDLWRHLDALGDYFEAGRRDDEGAQALLFRIFDHPAMDQVDARARAEFSIGAMIAGNVPTSDGILMQSMVHFDWQRLGLGDQWPYVAVRQRYEEWQLIRSMNNPTHPLHGAWMLLTEETSELKRRMSAHMPVASRLRDLLFVIDYQAPGLKHSVKSSEFDWWTARLDKPQLDLFGYARALFDPALVAVPFLVLGHRWWALSVFIVAGVAALIAHHFFAAGQGRWERYGNTRSGWARNIGAGIGRIVPFWPYLLAAYPFIALLAPGNWWGLGISLAAAIPTYLAMSGGATSPSAKFNEYWSNALVGGLFLGIAGGGDLGISPLQMAVVAPVVFLLAAPFARVRMNIAMMLDGRLRDFGVLGVALWLALLGAAAYGLFLAGWQPGATATTIFATAMWASIWLIFASRFPIIRIAGLGARLATLFLLSVMISLINPLTFNEDNGNGRLVMAALKGKNATYLEPVREELATMEARNPSFHRRLVDLVPVGRAQRIDYDRASEEAERQINAEASRLLPRTSPDLIARFLNIKVQLLRDLKDSDIAQCDAAIFMASASTTQQRARQARDIVLKIAAQGWKDGPAPPLTSLPSQDELVSAEAFHLEKARKAPASVGASEAEKEHCSREIAATMALADLPPEQLSAIFWHEQIRVRRPAAR